MRRHPHGEIESGLDALDFEEIIPLTRTIYARRTENDIGKSSLAADITFGQEFAFPISGIRMRLVGQANRREVYLIAHAEAAQAAHQQELSGRTRLGQSLEETARMLGIYLEELAFVGRFGQAGVMQHIVPAAMLLAKCRQLFGQRRFLLIR